MIFDLAMSGAAVPAFFFAGLLGTWFVGAVARFASTYFVKEGLAPVVGLSVAIGFVIAGGFRGIEAHDDLSQAALNLGMFAGLAIVWFRYFKRVKSNG